MNILLLGKNGQVGWELNRSLLPYGSIISTERTEADFSRPESLRKVVREASPDVIVNAVAYTEVDRAERKESEAIAVNAMSPGVLAEEARAAGALLVHFSTDYVFDGSSTTAYAETDKVNPINVYGKTKALGEQAISGTDCDHLVFRTSWVYAARGRNFMLTMLRLMQDRNSLDIVGDQFGVPTWARMIADVSAHCIHQSYTDRLSDDFNSGVYHLVADGKASWFEFADAIRNIMRKKKPTMENLQINRIRSSEYSAVAARPLNSCMSNEKIEKAFNLKMPGWENCLELCLDDIAGQ